MENSPAWNKFLKFKACINVANGVAVPFGMYDFIYNDHMQSGIFVLLNAYLFLSNYDFIKEQLFTKKEIE